MRVSAGRRASVFPRKKREVKSTVWLRDASWLLGRAELSRVESAKVHPIQSVKSPASRTCSRTERERERERELRADAFSHASGRRAEITARPSSEERMSTRLRALNYGRPASLTSRARPLAGWLTLCFARLEARALPAAESES